MRWLLLSVFCVSCVTQKKVNRWLAENPLEAARYCSEKFPPSIDSTDTTIVYVDSSGLEEAYRQLSHYADSILLELSKKGIDTVYIDSIRVEVRKVIKYRMRPCSDSLKVITKYYENTALIKSLRLENESLRATVTSRDQTISGYDKKAGVYKRSTWILAILVLLLLAFMTRKMWLTFII